MPQTCSDASDFKLWHNGNDLLRDGGLLGSIVNTRYTLPAALAADFTGMIAALTLSICYLLH